MDELEELKESTSSSITRNPFKYVLSLASDLSKLTIIAISQENNDKFKSINSC